jgi:hypothetical protein
MGPVSTLNSNIFKLLIVAALLMGCGTQKASSDVASVTNPIEAINIPCSFHLKVKNYCVGYRWIADRSNALRGRIKLYFWQVSEWQDEMPDADLNRTVLSCSLDEPLIPKLNPAHHFLLDAYMSQPEMSHGNLNEPSQILPVKNKVGQQQSGQYQTNVFSFQMKGDWELTLVILDEQGKVSDRAKTKFKLD